MVLLPSLVWVVQFHTNSKVETDKEQPALTFTMTKSQTYPHVEHSTLNGITAA